MKKAYLCWPYTHDDPEVIEARVLAADKKAAELMKKGYNVFSPLSHSHRIAHHIGNHIDHDFWLEQDLPFIDWCDVVFVPLVEGAAESAGIRREVKYATKIGKPIEFLEG